MIVCHNYGHHSNGFSVNWGSVMETLQSSVVKQNILDLHHAALEDAEALWLHLFHRGFVHHEIYVSRYTRFLSNACFGKFFDKQIILLSGT